MKKKLLPLLGLSLLLCTGLGTAYADSIAQNSAPANISASTERTDLKMAPKEQLNLTKEWDKTFAQSDKVNHSKVTFVNRYGITLAADMYVPKMQKANCLPLQSAAHSAQLRSRLPAFMRKPWQNAAF